MTISLARARAVGAALTFTVVATLSACSATVSSRAFALTLPERPDAFEQLETLVQAQGYALSSSDRAPGTFSVLGHAIEPEAVTFTVQLYRDGFAVITPTGSAVGRDGDRLVMSSAVADEYRDLALALRASLRSGSAR